MSETKPVARVWRVIEQGQPKTYWVAEGTGDEAGWKVLAEKQPDRFSLEYCDLYPASAITSLMEENRKETFRADSNHRAMLRHAEASSAKSVEIQNLKAYIDKMTGEVQDAIARERERAEAAEKRALNNEARAQAAEQKLAEAVKVMEQQSKALEPLSNAVFNDNGEISVSYPVSFTSEHCIAAYFADRAARCFIKEAGE